MTLALGAAGTALAWRLPLGALTDPGPGLWPLAVGVAVMAGSLMVIVSDDAGDYERFAGRSRLIVIAVIVIAVFIALFEMIGFILSGIVCFAFWLRFFGRESWRFTAVASIGGVGVLYVVFAVLLRVPLPDDLITRLWGA